MKFVEALYVEGLATEDNPRAIGQAFLDDVLKAEQSEREQFGEQEYSLQIAGIATDLIDRVVARAELLKSSGSSIFPTAPRLRSSSGDKDG